MLPMVATTHTNLADAAIGRTGRDTVNQTDSATRTSKQPDGRRNEGRVRPSVESRLRRLLRTEPPLARLWAGDAIGYATKDAAATALCVWLLSVTRGDCIAADRLLR